MGEKPKNLQEAIEANRRAIEELKIFVYRSRQILELSKAHVKRLEGVLRGSRGKDRTK